MDTLFFICNTASYMIIPFCMRSNLLSSCELNALVTLDSISFFRDSRSAWSLTLAISSWISFKSSSNILLPKRSRVEAVILFIMVLDIELFLLPVNLSIMLVSFLNFMGAGSCEMASRLSSGTNFGSDFWLKDRFFARDSFSLLQGRGLKRLVWSNLSILEIPAVINLLKIFFCSDSSWKLSYSYGIISISIFGSSLHYLSM